MPPKKRIVVEYECYRCGYKTLKRFAMNNHLYVRKSNCLPIVHKVELTEEIKAEIMLNHVYVPEIEPIQVPLQTPPQNQSVYIDNRQFNQLNQYYGTQKALSNNVKNMDTHFKLNTILKHKELELKQIDDHIEEMFEDEVDMYDDLDADDTLTKTTDDLFDIINKISKVDTANLDKLNVICNIKTERILIFYLNEWEEMLIDKGLTFVIQTLSNNYLSSYEMYLIRGLEKPIHMEQVNMRDCLEEYYSFLAVFKVQPNVKVRTDEYILERDLHASPGTYTLCIKYAEFYDRVKKRLKEKTFRNTRKQVMKILHINAQTNIAELNKHIIQLLHTDEVFMKHIQDAETLNTKHTIEDAKIDE